MGARVCPKETLKISGDESPKLLRVSYAKVM